MSKSAWGLELPKVLTTQIRGIFFMSRDSSPNELNELNEWIECIRKTKILVYALIGKSSVPYDFT